MYLLSFGYPKLFGPTAVYPRHTCILDWCQTCDKWLARISPSILALVPGAETGPKLVWTPLTEADSQLKNGWSLQKKIWQNPVQSQLTFGSLVPGYSLWQTAANVPTWLATWEAIYLRFAPSAAPFNGSTICMVYRSICGTSWVCSHYCAEKPSLRFVGCVSCLFSSSPSLSQ